MFFVLTKSTNEQEENLVEFLIVFNGMQKCESKVYFNINLKNRKIHTLKFKYIFKL